LEITHTLSRGRDARRVKKAQHRITQHRTLYLNIIQLRTEHVRLGRQLDPNLFTKHPRLSSLRNTGSSCSGVRQSGCNTVGRNTAPPLSNDCRPDNCCKNNSNGSKTTSLPYLRSDSLPGIVLEKSWIADPLDSSLEPCVLDSSFFGLGEGN